LLPQRASFTAKFIASVLQSLQPARRRPHFTCEHRDSRSACGIAHGQEFCNGAWPESCVRQGDR
jgi:hypothetical protein